MFRWFHPDFPIALEKEFKTLTKGLPPDEISLFQQLTFAFERLSKDFTIDVLHGSKHQVEFQSGQPWAHKSKLARCELCDLMIVAFRTNPFNARLTFLQNKSERISGQLPLTFEADMFQWELLASRPEIQGVNSFNPPKNLLKDALLSSVGTFGVFYQDTNNDFNMTYSTADILGPIRIGTSKKRRLYYKGTRGQIRAVSGYNEITSCSTLADFAHQLSQLRIGTPIIGYPVQGESLTYRSEIRQWLFNLIGDRIRLHDELENGNYRNKYSSITEDPLGISAVREFLGILKEYNHNYYDPDHQQMNEGGPSLVVIKVDDMLR